MATKTDTRGFKRAKRIENATGDGLQWVSQSGRVAVEQFTRRRQGKKVRVYYVVRKDPTPSGFCWDIVSHHKMRGPAFHAAHRLDRRLGKLK